MAEEETPVETPVDDNIGDETPVDPSPAEETPSDEPSGEDDKTPDDKAPVPYSRFKESRDELREEREARERDKADFEDRFAKLEQKPDESDDWDDDAPMTRKELKEYETKKDEERKDKEMQEWFKGEHKRLEEAHDGSDGLPKYSQTKARDFIRENPKLAFLEPEDLYDKMNRDAIIDHKAEQKLKAQKGDKVEGAETPPKKPAPPKDFDDPKDHDAYIRDKYSS